MSATATQTQGFGFAPVPDLPAKFCKGRVTDIAEPGLDFTEEFLQWNCTIQGYGASPMAWYKLKLRPEWLHLKADGTPFSPATDINFSSKEQTAKYQREWNNNVLGPSAPSAFLAFTGFSIEAVGNLAAALRAIPAPAYDKETGEPEGESLKEFGRAVTDVLREHLIGNDFGYTLVQQQRQTDEVNPETGKKIYVKTDKYAIGNTFFNTGDRFFDVNNEKTVESLRKKCEKEGNEGKYQFLIDETAF